MAVMDGSFGFQSEPNTRTEEILVEIERDPSPDLLPVPELSPELAYQSDNEIVYEEANVHGQVCGAEYIQKHESEGREDSSLRVREGCFSVVVWITHSMKLCCFQVKEAAKC